MDPEIREALLALVRGCSDLREATARVTELALNALMSAEAGECLAGAVDDALAFMAFPEAHWSKIRTNNVQERANREIKRRYRVVQSFPSRASLLRLVGAVMCEEEDAWAHQRAFSPESAARAWDARPARVPTEAELRAADAAAERVIAEARDRAGREE